MINVCKAIYTIAFEDRQKVENNNFILEMRN